MTFSLTSPVQNDVENVNTFSSEPVRLSVVPNLNDEVISRVGKINLGGATEAVTAKAAIKITRDETAHAPARNVNEHRIVNNSVTGSVIRELGNGLVLCTVVVEGNNVEITLPDNCFNFPVKYGTPFYYSMAERGGYSTPVISQRDPEPISAQDSLIFSRAAEMFGLDSHA